jgi:RNA ligase
MLLAQLLIEIEAGRVRQFHHPELPLTGYNYTETCQFDKGWNETNMQCRGLVLGPHGQVIARPFRKFFNYEELSASDKIFKFEDIARINRKEDGSLIIAFWYAGAWRFCTRGSFTSPQVAIAQELWDANPQFNKHANKYCTYCFELVGPRNVNVVRSYATDELILLGIIDTETGNEYPMGGILLYADRFVCEYAPNYPWSDTLFEIIKNSNSPNFEGIVVTLTDGRRFKLKSELYCQLHRVITGDWTVKRTMDVWMSQKQGKMDLDPSIPDEFYTDLRARLAEVDARWEQYRTEAHALRARVVQEALAHPDRGNEKVLRKALAIGIPECRPYLSLFIRDGAHPELWEKIAYDLFCAKEVA